MRLLRAALLAALGGIAALAAASTFEGRHLDRSFGQDGEVVVATPGSFHVGRMIATRDGGLLVLYHTGLRPTGGPGVSRLLRLRIDGRVEASFGEAGQVDVAASGGPGDQTVFFPSQLHEDAFGRILVAGLGYVEGAPPRAWHLMVLRFMPTGEPDLAFGQAGRVRSPTLPQPSGDACAGDQLQMQFFAERANGRFLVVGTRTLMGSFMLPAKQCIFALQFDAQGAIDTSFGMNGAAESPGVLLSARLVSDGRLDAFGQVTWSGGFRRWELDDAGRTLASSAIAGPARNGPMFADPGGPFLSVVYGLTSSPIEDNGMTIEVRDAAGALLQGLGDQGRFATSASGFRHTLATITPDGGAVALGQTADVASMTGAILYRHYLCVWRSEGRLAGCEAIAPGGYVAGDSTSYLAPDGSLYVSREDIDPLSASRRGGVIARFNVTAPLVEYHNDILGHYFTTYDGAEAQGIDRGAAGPGWRRTAQSFKSGGTTPVCRFYGTPGIGPNSHFYTIEPGECEQVKRDPGWTFEGLGFYATRVVNGRCEAPLLPVHRLYNNRAAQNDSNHRYVTDTALIAPMAASGWTHEGVVFCVRP